MKRPILAQLHRGEQILWTRRYRLLSNAARRATEIMLLDGEPGDVIEFSLEEVGYQIGTMRMHAGGSITFDWSKDSQ